MGLASALVGSSNCRNWLLLMVEYVCNKNLITDITKNSEFTHKLRDRIFSQGNAYPRNLTAWSHIP